ncbi:MAG: hypothetical protein C0403_13005 [Desulfobacterium sp.]|nr:hypothetical protein [Desulfobacterium sp.]
MENQGNMDRERAGTIGIGGFATKQVIVGILLLVVVIFVSGLILGFFPKLDDLKKVTEDQASSEALTHDAAGKEVSVQDTADYQKLSDKKVPGTSTEIKTGGHGEKAVDSKKTEQQYSVSTEKDMSGEIPTGVSFVEATMGPLRYELSDRFWGWRPNDIFSFVTDNVNNFQLGVIEVTRRTVEKLTENISRTGAASSFDKNLENARSTCFVIEAESLIFPSSEGRYKEGLEDLKKYAEKLKKKEARFFTRADNLIPLLREYENLLGSCDENLVKMREEDGGKVSFFKADNYFFYAKGVAQTLIPILEGIEKDFYSTLDRRNCLKELRYAIESCEHAIHISPVIILDSNLGSIFANHRANMAAHISHARYYIEVLIKTLST